MNPKLIKTEQDYRGALERIEAIFTAKPGTPEGDELDLLTTLVELYEKEAFPIGLPTPVEAIQFRMKQEGLKPKDLVSCIGSASKVSEVLSGKRSLSLSMMRKLVKELGIPAEVLLQEEGAEFPVDKSLQQGKHFPIAEMVKRGWFPGFQGSLAEAREQLEELLNRFVGPLGSNALIPAMNRQHVRDGSNQDEHALAAWRIRVAILATREVLPAYKAGTVTADFLRELARLSYLDSGPILAKEFLNKNGIHLICEKHLPKTHLDGAALRLPNGSPVVALTLRYDRLDNFWFTLFHELAHVGLHFKEDGIETFFDDLACEGKKDTCEKEADRMASGALIPESEWKAARFSRNSTSTSIIAFAAKLRIHPSIPAGRIRYECKDYKIHKSLLGSGKVRVLFQMNG
jgi:HTH-type transcriptional regulator/antitoxin HigA